MQSNNMTSAINPRKTTMSDSTANLASSPGTLISKMALAKVKDILKRFQEGQAIYSGEEVKEVCDYYITFTDSEVRSPTTVLQFLRQASICFASARVRAQLQNLPETLIPEKLHEHLNILLEDHAPTRLQDEYEAQPGSLFFVGKLVSATGIRSLTTEERRKPAVRLAGEVSQTALRILMRHEERIESFPKQDIQTLYSYMKEVNERGMDVWFNLVEYLRDAARPFASAKCQLNLVLSPVFRRHDRTIIESYNLLVADGALERLAETTRAGQSPSFRVEVRAGQDCVVASDHEKDTFHAKGTSHEGEGATFPAMTDVDMSPVDGEENNRDAAIHQEGPRPKDKRGLQSVGHLPHSKTQDDNVERQKIPLVGTIGPNQNALPSLGRKRHREANTTLTPRQIRDLVRQFHRTSPSSQETLLDHREVFYVGGSKKYQIRPAYFWVLIQPPETDEPLITEADMTKIFPQWKQYISAKTEDEIVSGRPVSAQPQAIKTVGAISSPTRDSNGRFSGKTKIAVQAIADKPDTLTKEVAAMTHASKELTDAIQKMMDSRPKQKKVRSSLPLFTSKKRPFILESEDEGMHILSLDPIDTPTKKSSRQKC